MRPLKVAYFKKWNDWLVHAPKSYTAPGNVKSPGYATVITWISEIWQDLDPALIARSFDHCGITSKSLADYGSQLIKPLSLNKSIYNNLKIFFSILKYYFNYFYDLFHIVAQEGVLCGKCPRLS